MNLIQDSLTLLTVAMPAADEVIAISSFIYLAVGFLLISTSISESETPKLIDKWEIADPWNSDIIPVNQFIQVEPENEHPLRLLPPTAEPQSATSLTALILDEISLMKLRPARLVCSKLGIPQKKHKKSRPLAELREEIRQQFLSNQQAVTEALAAAKAS